MKSTLYSVLAAGALLSLSSCYEDKGNYTYGEIDEMTITIPTGIKALKGAENFEFTPTVVSKLDGEIKADNPDYEFGCKINYRNQKEDGTTDLWFDINPERTMTVNYPANFPPNRYAIWYSVTNKKTGVTYNAKGSVEVLSTTYEGWMVLSQSGAEKKARLDIIFKDTQGKNRCSYDLLGNNAPEITEPTQVVMFPSMYSTGDEIYLMSRSGSYQLDAQALTTTSAKNMKQLLFILPNSLDGEPCIWANIDTKGYKPWMIVMTSSGDAYKINSAGAGTCFEYPINNAEWGGEPTYKLAPFIGTDPTGTSYGALLYNATDKRFMRWNGYGNYFEQDKKTDKTLYADPDPENKLFSYNTGMDLVHMEGTRRSGGAIYSVLQDNAGQRHVYAIVVGSYYGGLTQIEALDNISAENFNTAEKYAFHSQMPFILYCHGNKIYCYNTTTNSITDTATVDAGEHVTRFKFNLFHPMNLSRMGADGDPIFDLQYRLIVGTGNGQADGGKVRFFNISMEGKFSLAEEYSGFGEEVVDVVYRERRK